MGETPKTALPPQDRAASLQTIYLRIMRRDPRAVYLPIGMRASRDVVQKECKVRCQVEEFHLKLKQLTGIESCQGRKGRIQRNHIACAILVWLFP
ncbi:hypothetical protein [Moorena sp. SIO3A5]|uniref:Uncharacterized protein n=1 Tax=Moorena producens 3L TaxID=489825 RepID=F4XMH2_9CYAN|nr:hypothetical protein [Moorena sp. SIO3A5]EGJ33881.1 hypothetical protein LYNGBM3L_19910 [Moorena producens 3L]OLT69027.1 hypothetical protein BI334_32040 [Moorena producens 3L]